MKSRLSGVGSGGPTVAPPELPPRIDRAVKPPRGSTGQRSAQERLFGSDPPNYINAVNQSSLDRHNNNKAVRI